MNSPTSASASAPDPRRHAESRGWIESFLRFVPGFRGYLEHDYRQESDALLRKWLADRLQAGKRALDTYMVSLVDAGRLETLPACERLKNRLDGLGHRLRGAVRGYSGFFDFVQVDTGLLDRVYEHDLRLTQQVETLAASLEQLAAKPDPSLAAIQSLGPALDTIDQALTDRGNLLNGL